jgi:hypothetical protein
MSLSTAKYLFAAIGLLMLMGGLLAYEHTESFVRQAVRAQGTVTALVPNVSTDYSNTNGPNGNATVKYSYQPVVRFQRGSQLIQFRDSLASSPPAYHVGETVNVLYLESDPHVAKIESFMSLWFLTLFFGGLGTIFLAVGARMIFTSTRVPAKS